MDLKAIQARLDTLNNEGQGSSESFSENFWSVPFGKTTIRIVPSKFDPEMPFTELKFHNKIGKYPIIALSNFGEQDPVEDFIATLRETSDKENWSLSGKLSPRPRYFAPIIVRGEEEKGVRLWSFGITIYKALLSLAANEEYGDYTDITTGTDIIVEKVKGDPYPEITIQPKRNSSELSSKPEEVKLWLKEQPNPLESFKKFDYTYIKKQLQNYLTGGKAAPTSETPKADASPRTGEKEVEQESKKSSGLKLSTESPVEPAAPKAEAKKSVTKKFDDLFNDDEE